MQWRDFGRGGVREACRGDRSASKEVGIEEFYIHFFTFTFGINLLDK